jgi:hypothetical protein
MARSAEKGGRDNFTSDFAAGKMITGLLLEADRGWVGGSIDGSPPQTPQARPAFTRCLPRPAGFSGKIYPRLADHGYGNQFIAEGRKYRESGNPICI